jgi:hypothetical protein
MTISYVINYMSMIKQGHIAVMSYEHYQQYHFQRIIYF